MKKSGNFYPAVGKRAIDVLFAVPLLILLAPILCVLAVLVRLTSPGPAFFVQERLGKDGRLFWAYKFRTMTHKSRKTGNEVFGKTDEVTRLGYVLRRFKIDELPQLVNVLKGDMSLVGPRPALPSQLSEYNDTGRRRLMIRPGLTGLAQINGNIYLSWPQRWVYDAKYVDELSLKLDIWIVCRTMAVIVVGEDKFLNRNSTGNDA